ncbi:hydroxymethylbilane synthase [Candidatus Bandiella euplotis]|uniref:Porphobilinogen deaminase n=1 Tax=Candidatus Bandiella euplotis TaxID=1664265 RepID=A0ABZ0UN77_9RICK|nr:hydroxymethylbilane synthase [Candidatus Bandiella woodruffii]WPX96977.1 Porphobilinogen deaminase [Candidatus Bandiella woodruffii]
MLVRIATRESPLAVQQAMLVANALQKAHSNVECQLVKMKTQGDILLDQSLSKIGGKGLFLKELEQALMNDKADIAVHSMKDVPARFHDALEISCVLKREDDRDVFISSKYQSFYTLPKGATIGTSSCRRKGQILALRPELKVMSLRGNVGTRLKKLENDEVDAIILAAAGLKRIGLDDKINHYFSHQEMLPAIAQGAIGVQNRIGDAKINALLSPINDEVTQILIGAERAFLMGFGGDCSTPIAANCTMHGDDIILQAGYFMEDGMAQLYSVKEGEAGIIIELAFETAISMSKERALYCSR